MQADPFGRSIYFNKKIKFWMSLEMEIGGVR